MSDIVQNALRYDTTNTNRSDPPNPHNGQKVDKQESGEAIIGFDCSGFVCHVMIESGYRIDYESTAGLAASKAFSDVATDNEQSGDIILFSGHVGIVIEYNSNTKIGKFIHMSGRNNEGEIKRSYFITTKPNPKQLDPDGNPFYYGTSRPLRMFRRVNNDRYSAEVDLHINGTNPLPTLRPLGVNVYRNYVLKKPKTIPKTTPTLAEKPRNLPIHKKPQYESVPQRNGFYTLIKRIWGLP